MKYSSAADKLQRKLQAAFESPLDRLQQRIDALDFNKQKWRKKMLGNPLIGQLGGFGQQQISQPNQNLQAQAAMAGQQMAAYQTNNHYSGNTASGTLYWNTSHSTNSTTSATMLTGSMVGTHSHVVQNVAPPQTYYPPNLKIDPSGNGVYHVQDGYAVDLGLPDGSRIEVKADGSYEVIDRDAKITYKASRLREFNAYINASDKLEEFIAFCRQAGVDAKEDMLGIPIKLFIAWLIQEAAKADKEQIPDVPLLPDLRKRIAPRCIQCNRFIRRELARKQIVFCGPPCFERQYERLAA